MSNLKGLFSEMRYVKDGSISEDLCYKVFASALEMVVNDVINDSSFIEIPASSKSDDIENAFICMKVTSGDDFKREYSKGKWHGVDPYLSRFTGNNIAIKDGNRNYYHDIFLDSENEKRIIAETNRGRRYF